MNEEKDFTYYLSVEEYKTLGFALRTLWILNFCSKDDNDKFKALFTKLEQQHNYQLMSRERAKSITIEQMEAVAHWLHEWEHSDLEDRPLFETYAQEWREDANKLLRLVKDLEARS